MPYQRNHSLGMIFLVCLLLNSCTPEFPGPETQFVMGTICTVNLFDQGKPELYADLFARLRELEDIFSANKEGTDLEAINRNAGLKPVKVRHELIYVLSKALDYAERSRGFFDPSVGPLVKLWGIGTDEPRIPKEEEIRNALNLIDYRDIEINWEEGSVFLKRTGMAIDLGAIAKGYAADEAARLLSSWGVERAIIDLGGDIFALGGKKLKKSLKGFFKTQADTFWRIGIQDPRDFRGSYIGVLDLKNKSVVTSGTYERFFEEDGIRYHHIFSTESGFPVENGLLSVTIVADQGVDADALSTAVFALGWERGRELIAGVEGAAGIFLFDDLSVRLAGMPEGCFTLSAAEYRLVEEIK